MSNYSKSTNFAIKDALISGDPLKVIKGTDIDTEFNNISTAIATKTDNAAAVITGGTINGTVIGNSVAAAITGTTITATTSVATPLVGSSSTNTVLQSAGTQRIVLDTAGNVIPNFTATQTLGSAANPWGSLTSPVIDSGSGSLVLKGAGTTAVTITGANTALAGTLQGASTIGVGATTPSASGAGVSFPATQSASTDVNTLDDYEEGAWTPSVGGSATYTTQTGTYTKIGNVVYVQFSLVINAIGTGSTTLISGLPFTVKSGADFGLAIAQCESSATAIVSLTARASSSATTILLFSRTAAAASDANNAIFQNATTVVASGHYLT